MPTPLPDLLTQLDTLLALPSVSCTSPAQDMGNRAVIDQLAEWLEALGFAIEIQEISGHRDKANLIARLGSGSGGLVLAGHADTVPFNEDLWAFNPLGLTRRNGRLYGLGATDMKGFFPIAIEAARAFADRQLREPLYIVATADEESTMDGARQLAERGLVQARCAVIGEPTDLKPVRMHKGIMMEAITVRGRAGHSSNPLLGNSALEAMHEVMTQLLSLRGELQARYQNPMFKVAFPTLNLGCIHGGDNPNRICSRCELHFDLRPLPGMDNEELRMIIENWLTPVAEKRGVNITLHPLMKHLPAFEQSAGSELVKEVERLAGTQAEAVNFATEGPFLQQLGMETVILGPGSIDQAHQADEYMEEAQVKPAVALYSKLIEHYCL